MDFGWDCLIFIMIARSRQRPVNFRSRFVWKSAKSSPNMLEVDHRLILLIDFLHESFFSRGLG